MKKLLPLIVIFFATSPAANAGCGCDNDNKWESLVRKRDFVFTAIAISKDSSQATFKLKKTYRGTPPNQFQLLRQVSECDADIYNVNMGQTYMFAVSKESITKTGDPIVLDLGFCDGPRNEAYRKKEASFLKNYKFEKK